MSTRIDRISEEVMKALAEAMRSVKDPRVQEAMVSVVHCDVTNDLRYAKCYCGRVNIKFHRDRTSAGSYFMGKYAVTIRKSTAYRCLVDYPDSRCFSCCDTIVHYQYRRLYQKKIK